MKTEIVIVILLISACATVAQQSNSSGQGKNATSNPAGAATAKVQAKKTQADLSGFELDPNKRKSTRAVAAGSLSRGDESEVVLYSPSIGLAYSVRPVFYWAHVSGTAKVKFRLYDSEMNELYETDVTGQDTLTYPADAPELKTGATYSWTIHPRGEQAATPARIVVMAGSDRRQVQQELESSAGNRMQQRIQQARVFVEHLAWYDAIAAYTELISAYPNQLDWLDERAEIYAALASTQELAKRDRAQAARLRSGGQGRSNPD